MLSYLLTKQTTNDALANITAI